MSIYNEKEDLYSFGKSSFWTIPEKDIQKIRETNLDQYLKMRVCTSLQDVGDGKYFSRLIAVMEGTKSAIASNCFIQRCEKEKKDFDRHL